MKILDELKKGDVAYYFDDINDYCFKKFRIKFLYKNDHYLHMRVEFLDDFVFNTMSFSIQNTFINRPSSLYVSTHNDDEAYYEIKNNQLADKFFAANSYCRLSAKGKEFRKMIR